MKSFEVLVQVIESAKIDAEKFVNGNNAAGTRLRAKMQEVKNMAQAVRNDVSEVKNS